MASLFVYMNGYEVGEYIHHRSGAEEFVYSDSWLQRESGAIPLSLSLPITNQRHKGVRVYNYFENLLPDSKDIRQRIQARLGAKTDKPFDLLATIGKDCIGAIQLMSERADVNVKKIQGEPLSEADIAEELRNYETFPLGMSRDREFRISLAGAQEKTALLRHKKQWYRPEGTTPTTHILKLPIGRIEHSGIDLSDSVENEWLCLEILREFGVPVAHSALERFENIKVLVVERFDRTPAEDKRWIIRQPMEDMCQANSVSPALKYESDGGPGISKAMELLSASVRPTEDRKQFMQSVFLFWLLGAIDGHAKNFSIFLKPGGRFQLTPLYDVMSAYPIVARRQFEYRDLKMAMALHSKNTHYHWHNILPGHWFAESKRADFPASEMQEIIDSAIDQHERVIAEVSGRLPKDFPDDIAGPIFEGIKKVIKRLG